MFGANVILSRMVFATANPHKVEELKTLFAGVPWDVRSLEAFPHIVLPEETGATFAANARLKAEAVARATGAWALADDSGLCVDALGGAPGVYSSRYAGMAGNAARNITRLLEALSHIPAGKRQAHFLCVMALAGPSGECHLAEGRCHGEITFARQGTGGFGYDPVFFIPERGKTMAQCTPEEKNRISHRARAAMKMRKIIVGIIS